MRYARIGVGALAALLWLGVLLTAFSRVSIGGDGNEYPCPERAVRELMTPSSEACRREAGERTARAVALLLCAFPVSFGYLALPRRP